MRQVKWVKWIVVWNKWHEKKWEWSLPARRIIGKQRPSNSIFFPSMILTLTTRRHEEAGHEGLLDRVDGLAVDLEAGQAALEAEAGDQGGGEGRVHRAFHAAWKQTDRLANATRLWNYMRLKKIRVTPFYSSIFLYIYRLARPSFQALLFPPQSFVIRLRDFSVWRCMNIYIYMYI